MVIKKEASAKFYQKIHQLARKEKTPLKAMFELTYKCNFHCLHCYICEEKNKKELSTQQVKRILDQLKAVGCFHVGFTGGEIFLRKDIFTILDYAKNNGFRISLLTNGSLIDREVAQKIASLGASLNRVDVSVLGATRETFEKITGVKGSFAKVMRALKLLKQAKVPLQVKSTLLTCNKHEFLAIRRLARKLKAMFRFGFSVCAKTDGDLKPLSLQASPEEIFQIKKCLDGQPDVIDEQAIEKFNPANTGKKYLFRCGAGRTEVSISPYGEMNFCLEIHYPAYNILRGSFKEGWGKLRAIVENWKPDKKYVCWDCVLAGFCRFCPAKGGIFRDGTFHCSQLDREAALYEAEHSPFWQKIAPRWQKQKKRFSR
jgi:MoaA/NifB/PqqE/SkfB family radical SAM enzyme